MLLEEIVSGDRDARRFIAERVDSILCDRQQAFFNSPYYTVDLPVRNIADTTLLENTERSLNSRIFTGKSVWKGADFGKHILYLGSKKYERQDLDLWDEKYKIKVPENRWKKIKYVVYGDKDTPVELLKPLFLWCKEKKIEQLYFAVREEATKHSFKIWLKPVSVAEIELNSNLRLEDWLTSPYKLNH